MRCGRRRCRTRVWSRDGGVPKTGQASASRASSSAERRRGTAQGAVEEAAAAAMLARTSRRPSIERMSLAGMRITETPWSASHRSRRASCSARATPSCEAPSTSTASLAPGQRSPDVGRSDVDAETAIRRAGPVSGPATKGLPAASSRAGGVGLCERSLSVRATRLLHHASRGPPPPLRRGGSAHRANFLYFNRCGMTLSMPRRRFLSSS